MTADFVASINSYEQPSGYPGSGIQAELAVIPAICSASFSFSSRSERRPNMILCAIGEPAPCIDSGQVADRTRSDGQVLDQA